MPSVPSGLQAVPLQGKAPKKHHAIVTETLACFLPGRAKDLSAPRYLFPPFHLSLSRHHNNIPNWWNLRPLDSMFSPFSLSPNALGLKRSLQVITLANPVIRAPNYRTESLAVVWEVSRDEDKISFLTPSGTINPIVPSRARPRWLVSPTQSHRGQYKCCECSERETMYCSSSPVRPTLRYCTQL